MKFIGMIDALVSQIVPLHSYRTGSVANAPTDVPARTISFSRDLGTCTGLDIMWFLGTMEEGPRGSQESGGPAH